MQCTCQSPKLHTTRDKVVKADPPVDGEAPGKHGNGVGLEAVAKGDQRLLELVCLHGA